MQKVPKLIHSLWLQGQNDRPPLVAACLERWAGVNPAYQLEVLNRNDARQVLRHSGLPLDSMTDQAFSDVLRTKLLLDQGGVWVDATLLPVVPLEPWLDEATRESGFFAFDRKGTGFPLSSWFLAASPQHEIISKWWAAIGTYWDRPRTLTTYEGDILPPDPVACVTPGRTNDDGTHPYFWFHYLFQYLLENDKSFADAWERCVKISAMPPHALQQLFQQNVDPRESEILRSIEGTTVQKLNWRSQYPLEVISRLLGGSCAGKELSNDVPEEDSAMQRKSLWNKLSERFFMHRRL